MKNNRPNVFQLKPLLAMLVIAQCACTAQAGERESLEQLRATTTSLINALVQEGVLSKEKADALLKKSSQDAAELANSPDKNTAANDAEGKAEPKSVRVQLVPEFVKQQLREEIKQDVMAKAKSEGWAYPGSIPDWLNAIEWEGDMRLRYESDIFDSKNTIPSTYRSLINRNIQIDNTTEDRDRMRVRARLGANVKINDWLSGGIRMTTGSATDPISPNQTESASTGKFTFSLDRAFLKAKLNSWATVSGGRFANPFFHTDLVWDPDLAFDGIAASFAPQSLSKNMSVFGTLGAFPIEEVNKSDTNLAENKWLYGGQVGINWRAYDKTTVKLGVAYYDFENVEGISNGSSTNGPYDSTLPIFRQKGNRTFNINAGNTLATTSPKYGLASEFKELNITGQVDIANFEPVHVVLLADYVKNLGVDLQEIASRTNTIFASKEDEAYQLRLTVGMLDTLKRNDWQVWGGYKRLEADSVLDGFTDSDFHLGGTNTKGWLLGVNYGVDKNTWVSARYYTADQLANFGLVGRLGIDVLMLDLNAKF